MKPSTFQLSLEPRSDRGTDIGTDPENIAIVKIIKDNEISNFLFWSRDSQRRRDKDRYTSREHRDR